MSTGEPNTQFPLWIELSGLPVFLLEKTRGPAAWTVLKKVIELDCDRNHVPGTVEIAIAELESRSGVSAKAIHKSVEALRKHKLLAAFVPESDEEAALFQVRAPLVTPKPAEEVAAAHPGVFGHPAQFRYGPVLSPEEQARTESELQQIVDLYFDAVGLKMNVFILDELRLMRERFPFDEIKRTFNRAKVNEIRSLRWVFQELMKRQKPETENDAFEDTF